MNATTLRLALGALSAFALLAPSAGAASTATTRIDVPSRNGVEVLEARTVGTDRARVAVARGAVLPSGTVVVSSVDRGRVRVVVVRRGAKGSAPASKRRLGLRFVGASRLTRVARGSAVVTSSAVLRSRAAATVCVDPKVPSTLRARRLRGTFQGRSAARIMQFAAAVVCAPRAEHDRETRRLLATLGHPQVAPKPAATAPAPVAPPASAPAPATPTPAALSANPGGLSFTARAGETTPTQAVVVRNAGQVTSGAPALSLAGDDAAAFVLDAGTCTAPLADGASCVARIAFAPTGEEGARSATLTVAGTPGGTAAVALVGAVAREASPQFSVTPGSKTFEERPIYSSATQAFVVTNTGGAPADDVSAAIGGRDTADFFRGESDCVGGLAPGESCTVEAAFGPGSPGTKTATLDVYATGALTRVPLQGSAYAPASFTRTGGDDDFGEVPVGRSVTRTIVLTNTGERASDTLGLGFDGNAGNESVSLTRDACSGVTVAPGASCELDVRFAPDRLGTLGITIYLTVPHPEYGAEIVGAIGPRGVGTDPVGLTASPQTRFFETTYPGTTSSPVAVTVTNTRDAAYPIDFSVDDPAFAVDAASPCFDAALAAGASCTFDVAFQPAEAGNRRATLTLADDSAESDATSTEVVLFGWSIEAPVIEPTTDFAFGPQPVGTTSAPRGFTLTNGGAYELSEVALTTDSPDFTVDPGDCGATLAAGASCSGSVTFTPAAGGDTTSALRAYVAQGPAVTSALTGTGVPID